MPLVSSLALLLAVYLVVGNWANNIREGGLMSTAIRLEGGQDRNWLGVRVSSDHCVDLFMANVGPLSGNRIQTTRGYSNLITGLSRVQGVLLNYRVQRSHVRHRLEFMFYIHAFSTSESAFGASLNNHAYRAAHRRSSSRCPACRAGCPKDRSQQPQWPVRSRILAESPS